MNELKHIYKRNLRITFVFFLFLITSFIGISQNDPQISQQGLQRFIYDPASTGTSNFSHISFIGRSQWTGFKDAPFTNILNGHTFLSKYKVGLGAVVIHDRLGLEQNTLIKTSYSYHVWLDELNILSFGLSAGIFFKKIDIGSMILEETNNDALAMQLKNSTKPDFDFGVEYNRENLTIGISSTHFLNSHKNANNYLPPRHFHAYANYRTHLFDNYYLRGILSYYNTQNVNIYELTAIGEIDDLIWAGMSYRIKESTVILVGFNVINNLRIGYSYDINMSGSIKRYSSGSHEIFIHYKIGQEYKNSNSPRFFN